MKVNKITINKAINKVTHNTKDKAENFDSVLPKELPLEKKIYIITQRDIFERVKDTIQVSIDKIRR